jgi:hypothetical protein
VGLPSAPLPQSRLPALERGEQGADLIPLVPRHGAHVHVLPLAGGAVGRLRDLSLRAQTLPGLHSLPVALDRGRLRRPPRRHLRRPRVHLQRQGRVRPRARRRRQGQARRPGEVRAAPGQLLRGGARHPLDRRRRFVLSAFIHLSPPSSALRDPLSRVPPIMHFQPLYLLQARSPLLSSPLLSSGLTFILPSRCRRPSLQPGYIN